MNLIGLIGFSGSGKTTIAKALGMRRLAFADVLKQKAASALGIGTDELEARKAEFRPLLVELGKAGRRIDPMRWVVPVMQRVRDSVDDVCIDDVRYVNECEAILQRGGRLFCIRRDGVSAANSEEEESIREILHDTFWRKVYYIYNTTPADAAAAILAAVKEAK